MLAALPLSICLFFGHSTIELVRCAGRASKMVIQILAPPITSYSRVMPLPLILARGAKLIISSCLTIYVTLKHLAVFALVSVPFLTVVYTVTISLSATSDFGNLNRISVWLCPAPMSVCWGCIMAKVLRVWPYTGTNLPCVGGIFDGSGRLVYCNHLYICNTAALLSLCIIDGGSFLLLSTTLSLSDSCVLFHTDVGLRHHLWYLVTFFLIVLLSFCLVLSSYPFAFLSFVLHFLGHLFAIVGFRCPIV